MKFPKFIAASVSSAPVLFDLEGTIQKCCSFIDEAADNGADIIVFPETFISAYPWWVWMSVGNHERLNLYKKLFKSSVDLKGKDIQAICQKAKERNIFVVVGVNEIDQMTLYNTQVFINHKGEIIGKRRKLVPTGEERSIWGRGDGEDLVVFDTQLGKLSGLICYENTMALSRYALYEMGAQIHIANWPGYSFKGQPRDQVDVYDLTSKYIAFEGQMFVIASSAHMGEEEYAFYKELDPTLEDSLSIGGGFAGIISPFGDYVSEPIRGEEGIAYGEVDLEKILDSKHLVDSVGHYARGDVTKLFVNQQSNNPVIFGDFQPKDDILIDHKNDVKDE